MAEFAAVYHRGLIRNVRVQKNTPSAKESTSSYKALSIGIRQEIAEPIRQAEVVLWRMDLYMAAREQAQSGAFTKVPIPADLLPSRPQLWVLFGGDVDFNIRSINATLYSILLTPKANGVLPFCLAHPRYNGIVIVDDPPYVHTAGLIEASSYAADEEARELFACLSFMHSTVAASEPLSLPRPTRRRLTRDGLTTSIHIVRLRRKERGPNEDTHLSEREYQCQWIVRAHARKPNPRMKEQRPIWVRSYVKGPQDKPLKPPTRTVTVVSR